MWSGGVRLAGGPVFWKPPPLFSFWAARTGSKRAGREGGVAVLEDERRGLGLGGQGLEIRHDGATGAKGRVGGSGRPIEDMVLRMNAPPEVELEADGPARA